MLDDVLDRLLAYWKRQGVRPARIKADPEDIAAWEERYCVRVPKDLREYVQRLNGIEGGEALEFGDDLMSFLPLAAMKPEPEWDAHSTRDDMFVFVDHCISCSWWCLRLGPQESDTTEVYFGGGPTPKQNRLVARSLPEFFELYISDPTFKSFV